jgi:glycosyltransferase involved in cell wall biosynthesis
MDHAGISWLKGWDERKRQNHPGLVDQADIVIIQRDFPRFEQQYEDVMAAARSSGKPVVYEIDDLIFDLPAGHVDARRKFYTESIPAVIKAMLEADLVTTSSGKLKAKLGHYNKDTILLENYLDDRLWKKEPARKSNPDLPVTIGYMGSPSHAMDLEYLAPVIKKLRKRFKENIHFAVYGFPAPEWLLWKDTVTSHQFSHDDYGLFVDGFRKQVFDIAIAPLLPVPFNEYKSSIKYLEYSAVGIPGVYSSIPAYRSIVRHGLDGFLASSVDEWEANLITLIENPHLRGRIGLNAQNKVYKNWMVSQHYSEWLTAYMHIIKGPRINKRATFFYQVVSDVVSKQKEASQVRIGNLTAERNELRRLVSTKDAYINEILGVLDKTVKTNRKTIQAQQKHIAQLETENQRLNNSITAIQSSKTWKIANTINNLFIKLHLKR